MPNLSIFSGLTGRNGNPTGDDLRSLIIAAFGTNKRGGPDTRKAAEKIGVSQRTVQRWLAGQDRKERSKPRKENLAKIKVKARQASSTKKGRAEAIQERRTMFANRSTVKISVNGMQGPSVGGRGYARPRQVTLDLTRSQADMLFDAYADGGEREFEELLSGHFSDNYVDSWEFRSITGLKFF
ncbi:hypothetical protein ACUH92_08945 [Dermabacteraceae bacterium CCM 9520]